MKYIKLYEEFNSFELNAEQKEFLDKYAKWKWKLNQETGLVDIDGDFNCRDKNLTSFLGIKFSKVGGDFHCGYNKLTSLKGCPTSVGGYFNCCYNQLISLEGCPTSVGGNFDCSYNQLTSLQGCPARVFCFDCCNNQLTSLQGCSTNIGNYFSCHDNELTSLQGCPTSVDGYFYTHNNPISDKGIDLVINNTIEQKDYTIGLILSLPDLSKRDLGFLTKDLEYSNELGNIIRNNHKSELLINILKEYNKDAYDKLSFVDKEKSDKMHDMGFND